MPRKVVITAAGLGTRLLPISKELPKEMLPIFVRGRNGIVLKPLLQALFEQLYAFGFRDFCFVVGRGKRSIEDHFTPDWDYVRRLNSRGKSNLVSELEKFYEMVEDSRIAFINQPEPKGFGHAVLTAKLFVGNDPFMVCAGDTYIFSEDNSFLKRMVEAFTKDVSTVLLLQEVSNPRQYGVAIVEPKEKLCNVLKVVEKPELPPSNLAIMPFYIFRPEIIGVLEGLAPGVGGEIQLTDGIQNLIERGCNVVGVPLKNDEVRLDIGAPETYFEALSLSHKLLNL
ncbi:MAG: UTP--glucose-1-phosphate uridylyltransferase [Nitrososphaeria archaeon]|nr:UTP--glucose-1-phosphate uridylyltransferase [Nitrososphaeria archaeon]